jgi:hypothetical protein
MAQVGHYLTSAVGTLSAPSIKSRKVVAGGRESHNPPRKTQAFSGVKRREMSKKTAFEVGTFVALPPGERLAALPPGTPRYPWRFGNEVALWWCWVCCAAHEPKNCRVPTRGDVRRVDRRLPSRDPKEGERRAEVSSLRARSDAGVTAAAAGAPARSVRLPRGERRDEL